MDIADTYTEDSEHSLTRTGISDNDTKSQKTPEKPLYKSVSVIPNLCQYLGSKQLKIQTPVVDMIPL